MNTKALQPSNSILAEMGNIIGFVEKKEINNERIKEISCYREKKLYNT